MDINKFRRKLEHIEKQEFLFLQPIIDKIGHEKFGGMTSSNILKVLNLAAQSLDPEKVYMELGTYKGLTLMGAMLGNEGKQFIAIDDFSQYDGSEMELRENFSAFFPQSLPPGFHFYNLSIENFLQDYSGKDIGVVFLDALHTHEATLNYFHLLHPHLAESAILIFDDAAIAHEILLPSWVGEVWEAIDELLISCKDLMELAYYDSVLQPGWHLGLRILAWQG